MDGPQIAVTLGKELVLSSPCIGTDLIIVDGLNPDLTFHKIFCFQEVIRNTSLVDYFVDSEVSIFRNGKVAARLPSSIGQDTTNTLIQTTLVTLFPLYTLQAGNSTSPPNAAVQESIGLSLSKNFTANTVANVGFARCQGEIDKVSFNVKACGIAAGMQFTAFRALLGIISSANPF